MNISLKAIDKDNFEAVAGLQLSDEQKDWLHSNEYSIAEASFHPHYITRAVYLDQEPIGFAMYVPLASLDMPGEYSIYRFMIDSRQQGKGYGRAALNLILDEIREKPDAKVVWISYWPANKVAEGLYASLGFVEEEVDDSGEICAGLRF